MTRFIGRKLELNQLLSLKKQSGAHLVIIKGRRRIGKSRLVQEFAGNFSFLQFTGFPPRKKTTAQSQRDEFTKQLARQRQTPVMHFQDWSDIFYVLSREVITENVVILFDEISWMGSKDHDFLGKLKNAWDLYFKNNSQLMLILCGSVSSWIEENIIRSTGFLGRPSLYITLEELPLSDCNKFWENSSNITSYEKFKILSVSGGVPRYLELIKPEISAEENIQSLCFGKNGLLVDEFDRIFSDIFMAKSETYTKLILNLANGPRTQSELIQALKLSRSGDVSQYLKDLTQAGFVARDYTWSLHNGHLSRLSRYRLKDNYVRFYLRFILPNKPLIQKNGFMDQSLTTLPGWKTVLGLQFENLVLNNRKIILDCLGIKGQEVIFDNPFFQKATKHRAGCQIDYLIHTKFETLYLCEIKFSKTAVEPKIINQVQQKIDRLDKAKGFSCRPVLIHVNGVHEDVIDSGFFSQIIDFGELLED